MNLRRFNRKIKSRVEKGKPHSPFRHVIVCRLSKEGKKYEWHYTKGFRRWV